MNESHHEMILEQTHTSGVEEWYCPTCGRRFLVQRPPAYKMVIVEPSDQATEHDVGKKNIASDSVQVIQAEESQPVEEFRLIPWLKWFEKVDFDPKWG